MRSILLYKMFKLCVFLVLSVASCYGGASDNGICGRMPQDLNSCLLLPPGVSREIQSKCARLPECERLTCIFREYNLLDGEVINKEMTIGFFDDFALAHPEFATAVEHVKDDCLGSAPLKPQGVYLNCPAYDMVHCSYKNLVKHANLSQWTASPNCMRARTFASLCPICPDECFSPEVPKGSCNC
ncbi:uncharacterized protein LOC110373205 isoform X1 [Helicoverpa armigera]|uniref:uncharacterized protein LOC110373205 isoform X1 n=1 Tax=Helicoverpa armigera TaxID=29058 RepID=UPI003083EBB2